MKVPRISKPEEFVEIVHEDKGDIHPVLDINGNRYEAYTSVFKIAGKNYYSFVDKALSKESPDYRFALDCQFLRGFDLDLTKAVRE